MRLLIITIVTIWIALMLQEISLALKINNEILLKINNLEINNENQRL